MNVFDQTLLTELAQRLGWAIVHSLWQGTLVAGLLALALWMVPRRLAEARYAASCLALLTIFGLFVASFVWAPLEVRETTAAGKVPSPIVAGSEVTASPTEVAGAVPSPISAIETVPQDHVTPPLPPSVETSIAKKTPRATWTDRLGALPPWLAPSWLAGVLLLSLWRLGGWIAIMRLRSLGTARVPDAVVRTLHDLARRLGVSRPVRVFQSTLAQTPLVIGWFRPVILLPCAVLTGLSPQQIEAILTHELAHIRRHDYLVNLVQTALETLLFHHPAVWWISHRIRAERECCCDDLAVQICGDRVVYARTLATLGEHLAPVPTTAMAASAGSLLDRIRRVVGQPAKPQKPRGTWLAGALILVACIVISLRVVSAQGKAEADSPPQENHEPNVTDDELASFPQAVAKRVTAVIENCDLPFVTDERLKEIDAEFIALVTMYQRNDLSDERKRAILVALENRRHLALAKHDTRALNTTYLKFPDRIKTLQWKVFMALTRAPLTEPQQQQRTHQRNWMRKIVTSLPEDRHSRRTAVLADLESRFRDPLCTPFDRPMTKQQFLTYQPAIETYLSGAKTGVEENLPDRSRSIKPHNPLPFVVHHLAYESLKAQYHNEKHRAQFPLFDSDRVGSNGAQGGYVHLGFMSNRLFRGGTRALDDVEKGHSVVDATTGYLISAPRESREPGKFRRWVHERSKGDFGYDDTKGGGLFAVRGAKLASLDVKNWIEADAVTDDALRALLKNQGKETISLKKYYAAHRDEHKTHPPTEFIGPYIGILTKEGRLAVVHIEDFSGPENISYRVRVRQQDSQSTAGAEPATISGRIVLDSHSRPLPDGIYRVRPTQSNEAGVEIAQSDTDGTVVLLQRLIDNFGTATMWSTANDNTHFRINLKSAGPFSQGDDIGHRALMIDGLCVMVWGHSDPDKDHRVDLSAGVVGKGAAARIAARLGIEPRLRQHPGHKMDVRFSPTKRTFRPGKPVVLQMAIKNVGDKPFLFYDGGRQRGPRNNQFGFTAFRRGGDGPEVPDTGDPLNFGGMAAHKTLKPGEVFQKQIDIAKWFDLSKPDTYKINCRFEMKITPDHSTAWIDWDDVAQGTALIVVANEPEPDLATPDSEKDEQAATAPARDVVQQWLTLIKQGARDEAARLMARGKNENADDVLSMTVLLEAAAQGNAALTAAHVHSNVALVVSKPFDKGQNASQSFIFHMVRNARRGPEWQIYEVSLVGAEEIVAQLEAFRATPVNRPVDPRGFGLTSKRTLPRTSSRTTALDLDTNRLIRVPNDFDTNREVTQDPIKWIAVRGIDVMPQRNPNRDTELSGLGGLFQKVRQVKNKRWDESDAAQVRKLLITAKRGMGMVLRAPDGSYPVTYVFETLPHPTGESRQGILQVLVVDQNEQAVTLRYKLVGEATSGP